MHEPMGAHRRGAAQGIDVESTERKIKISGMPRFVFCLVIFFCCQMATAAADKILSPDRSVDAASAKEIVESSQDALSGRRGVTPGVLPYSCGGCTWDAADGILKLQGQADCGSICLATLNFDSLQITSVDAGAFDTTGLSHVTKLTLAGNLFTSLPESVFDKMTGLRTLDLSENGLASVHSALFDKLTFMYRLYLNQNQLQILSLGVFDQLTALNYLYLQDNKLTSVGVSTGLFDKNTQLQGLYLDKNEMTSLNAGMFDKNVALKYLNLGENRLETVPPGWLDKLALLQKLHLSKNQIVFLPTGSFDELTVLTELYLNGNQLSNVHSRLFDELTALLKLDLSGNPLTSLPLGVFDKPVALTDLYLGQNSKLVSLPAGIFDRLSAMSTMHFPPASQFQCFVTIPATAAVKEQGSDSEAEAQATDKAPYDAKPRCAVNGSPISVTIPTAGEEATTPAPSSTGSASTSPSPSATPTSMPYIASMAVRFPGTAAEFTPVRTSFVTAVQKASPAATSVNITSTSEIVVGRRRLLSTSLEVAMELYYADQETADAAAANNLTQSSLNSQMSAAGLLSIIVTTEPKVRATAVAAVVVSTTPIPNGTNTTASGEGEYKTPLWSIIVAALGGLVVFIVGAKLVVWHSPGNGSHYIPSHQVPERVGRGWSKTAENEKGDGDGDDFDDIMGDIMGKEIGRTPSFESAHGAKIGRTESGGAGSRLDSSLVFARSNSAGDETGRSSFKNDPIIGRSSSY